MTERKYKVGETVWVRGKVTRIQSQLRRHPYSVVMSDDLDDEWVAPELEDIRRDEPEELSPEAQMALDAMAKWADSYEAEPELHRYVTPANFGIVPLIRAWQKTQQPEQLYLVAWDEQKAVVATPTVLNGLHSLSWIRRTNCTGLIKALHPRNPDGSFGKPITGSDLEVLLK